MEQDFQVYEFKFGEHEKYIFEAMGIVDANRHRTAAVSYFVEHGHPNVNAAELEGPFRVDGSESMRQQRWVVSEEGQASAK